MNCELPFFCRPAIGDLHSFAHYVYSPQFADRLPSLGRRCFFAGTIFEPANSLRVKNSI
jgi:hypothetical protein